MRNMKEEVLSREFKLAKIIDSYAKVAWFYDYWALLTETKASRKVLEYAGIRDGEHILEVAVGTGMLFKKIVNLNPHGKNEGVELAPKMLARAQKRLSGLPVSHYRLIAGNAYQLPYTEGSFDLVVNNFMLDLLPVEGINKVLAEFYRVLKPDGRVVISTMSFGEKWYHQFWQWVARRLPGLLTGCRPVAVAQYLQKTGFTNLKIARISQNTFPAEIISARK